jgi:hypothetical protein
VVCLLAFHLSTAQSKSGRIFPVWVGRANVSVAETPWVGEIPKKCV